MEKKLEKVFREIFGDLDENKERWNVLEVEKWDSIVHMALIAAIETEFSIVIPPQDFLHCTSFAKILEMIGNSRNE